MNIRVGRRSGWLIGIMVFLIVDATFPSTVAKADGNRKPPEATVLRGTVAHAPSRGVTLILNKNRQAMVESADGSFSFSMQLQEPTYAELEFDFRKKDTLAVFLLPEQPLTLNCDASDIFGTAKFTGKASAENDAVARLQIAYSRIDYDKLFRLSPEEFLLSLRRDEEALKSGLAQSSSRRPLNAGFIRFEGERINYFGPLLRVTRLGLSGDWKEYASHLDFNDTTLL